jgi:hypothetical protein
VYVGSSEIWQCIKEMKELMIGLFNANSKIKGLILTPNTSDFDWAKEDDMKGKITLLSAEFSKVNYYLNAADYAVFLRKPGNVNRVASPVKFAEYALTGLQVISTDAVVQTTEIARKIGSFVYYDFNNLPDLTFVDNTMRNTIALRAKRELGRSAINELYEALYEI